MKNALGPIAVSKHDLLRLLVARARKENHELLEFTNVIRKGAAPARSPLCTLLSRAA